MGESPVAFYAIGDGHACHHAVDGMKNGGFKIVQTSYMDEFAELADVILPSKIWAEEEGHYLTTDGRIELNRQALIPGVQQRSVSEVLAGLAEKSGFSLQSDWQAVVTDKISSIVLA
jgi:predicted molibdopterin-dependent oxidoreductase YjgC